MKIILARSPKPLWQWKLIFSITDSLTLLFYCWDVIHAPYQRKSITTKPCICGSGKVLLKRKIEQSESLLLYHQCMAQQKHSSAPVITYIIPLYQLWLYITYMYTVAYFKTYVLLEIGYMCQKFWQELGSLFPRFWGMQANKHTSTCFLFTLLFLVKQFMYINVCKQLTIYFKF